MKLSPNLWFAVFASCGVKPVLAEAWSRVFADTMTDRSFSKGPAELAPFTANVLHETMGLSRLTENLNYTAGRIRELGKASGPGTRWARAAASADSLAGNPEGLAEVLYGGRHGNVKPGDGWRFRGRSPIHLTFHDNYARVGLLVGQDLTSVPDLAAQPHFGLEIALAWWEDRVPDDIVGNDALVRRVVNGGKFGLAEVSALTRTIDATLSELLA